MTIRTRRRMRIRRSAWYEWARRERYDALARVLADRAQRDELRQIRDAEKK